MKYRLLLILAIATLFTSCTEQKKVPTQETDAGTKIYTFADSCQHLIVNLSLELPLGTDSASMEIRDSLIADFIRNTEHPGYEEEGTQNIKPYTGNMNDPEAIVEYYGRADYDYLLKLAKNDYNQRIEFLEEDTTMTEEDKQSIMDDVPMWAYDLKISRTTDTPRFTVYSSEAYVYFGGAHGGVAGSGTLTFNKTTGKMITEMIARNHATDMQGLLRKGLLNYYAEAGDTITDAQLSERLQLTTPYVPLPVMEPCPNATGDSIIFTYGQYEIACYADGMPSFKLAVKDIKRYLNKEVLELLSTQP